MFDDDFIREYLALQSELRQRTEAYLQHETILSQVARSPLSNEFNTSEAAEMQFDNGERIQGEARVSWPDHRLKASFHRHLQGPSEIPTTNAGTARVVPIQTTGWSIERSHIDDAQIHGERSDADAVSVSINYALNARGFSRTLTDAEPRFRRIAYRGGNLEGFPHEGFDADARILQFNQLNTTIFGRPSILRSVASGRDPDDNLLTISYEGARLDDKQNRTLWVLLSFFVGPRVEIVATEAFDGAGLIQSLQVPNGVEYSGAGKPPLRTAGSDGEPLAQQFPALLDRVHAELEKGFPWHIAFHHLEESYSNYPESAVKNLSIALDSVIEAHVEDVSKSRFIGRNDYKLLIEPLIAEIRRISAESHYSTEFADHMEEVLRRENHRGTTEKRNMFWAEFGIDVEPYKEVLAFRNDALHTGHVLNYLKPIDYIAFSKEVDKLRTVVNRAFLRRLGYHGPMWDFESGSSVET